MDAPSLVCLLTAVIAVLVHIKYQVPVWRAKRRLDRALGQKGLKARMRDTAMAWRMIRNPNVIFSESDTPELRALKQAYVDEVKAAQPSGWKIMRIILVGFGMSVIAAVVESIIKGKP